MRRWLIVLCGLLALLAVPGAPAGAAPAPTLAPVMLVLDGSGSMAEKAGPETKIVGAEQAVGALLAQLPGNARLGLETYGTHTGSTAADQSRGCQDVSVVHPVAPLDRTGLARAANAVRPRGYTPIGLALKKAAAALPHSGPRSIVLVSDGEDTCAPPDPCDVARQLAKAGVDLRIHTIGFDVDPQARTQLLCIAQATGGSYADAPDAASLGPVLRRSTGQALRNYQPAGTPVRGGPDKDSAPALGPGTYLDTLGTASRQYYAVDVPDRTTVYFSATAVYSRVRSVNQSLHLRLKGPGGSDCGISDNDSGSSRSGDSAPLTAAVSWLPGRPGQPSGCSGSGRYVFQVYRNSNGSDLVPLELSVGLEPPVTAAGPAPAARPVPMQAPTGPATAVTGGGSFGQAATLAGSGRYTDSVEYGEYVFYRVRLDWGQAVAASVRYAGSASPDTAGVEESLYAPYRARIGAAAASYTGRPLALPALATYPVRYRNREAGAAAERAESVAGWYYLAVKLGRGARAGVGGGAAVPVQVDVVVAGGAEAGPTYAVAATASPTDPTGSPSASASPSEAPSPTAVAGRSDDSGGGHTGLWVVLIVVGVALIGGGGALVARTRHR